MLQINEYDDDKVEFYIYQRKMLEEIF